MKTFVEKYFYNRRKKTDSSLWKTEKKMVSTSQKIRFLNREKLALAVIFFKNWISPYFNNGFL